MFLSPEGVVERGLMTTRSSSQAHFLQLRAGSLECLKARLNFIFFSKLSKAVTGFKREREKRKRKKIW